jgi:hypothetical protein
VDIQGIGLERLSKAEAMDVMEEIRYLVELADDGGFELSPAFRSLLANAYMELEAALERAEAPASP